MSTFNYVDWLTQEGLRMLLNELECAQFANTDHNKEFTKPFAIGDTVRVPKPQRWNVTTGMNYQPQAMDRPYTTITVDPLEAYGLIIDDRYTDRIVIWRVIPRSPAYYAGIQPGDVITVFNGNNVTTVGALRASVRAASPGNVSMSVSRSNKVRVYQIEAP